MSPNHKTLTKEEALALLKKHEEDFKQYEAEKEAKEEAENQRWDAEIARLESRVKERFTEIDLGDGDMLAIRTALSETESTRLGKLYIEWFTPAEDIESLDEDQIAERENVAYEILALVTANPKITVDWLKGNPDRFSTDDAVNIILTYMEDRQRRDNERVMRLVETANFRKKLEGAGIRGSPDIPRDKRPKGVEGSS